MGSSRSAASFEYCRELCPYGQQQQDELDAQIAVKGSIVLSTRLCHAGAAAVNKLLAEELGLNADDPAEVAAVNGTSDHYDDQVAGCPAMTGGPESTSLDEVRAVTAQAVVGELLNRLPHERAMELFPRAVGLNR